MLRRERPIPDEQLDWAIREALHAETAGLEPSPAVWQRMLTTDDKYMRLQLAADLRDYCRRDTYAMVEIHRSLVTMLRTMKVLAK